MSRCISVIKNGDSFQPSLCDRLPDGTSNAQVKGGSHKIVARLDPPMVSGEFSPVFLPRGVLVLKNDASFEGSGSLGGKKTDLSDFDSAPRIKTHQSLRGCLGCFFGRQNLVFVL